MHEMPAGARYAWEQFTFHKVGEKATTITNFLLYVILWQAILGGIHAPELANRNPTIAFNLIFQFLFFELRNANKVRKWFHRKLSLELDELLSKTTTGKLFDKLSVRVLSHTCWSIWALNKYQCELTKLFSFWMNRVAGRASRFVI